MLQYDKLYQSLKKVSGDWHAGHLQWDFAWDYLRFYTNGVVISCQSNDDVESIGRWFQLPNENKFITTGSFVCLPGGIVEIEYTSAFGDVKIDGQIMHNSLIVRTHQNSSIYWDYFQIV
jgi:hypothetical protein